MTPAIAATYAIGAALLAAGVALKWADRKAERLVDDSHIPLPTGAAESVERAAWEVQRVINHWSSVPPDVLAERAPELADLEACRDRIAALRDTP